MPPTEAVLQEQTGGAIDEEVFAACVREQRTLLTLDSTAPMSYAFLPTSPRASPSLRLLKNPSIRAL